MLNVPVQPVTIEQNIQYSMKLKQTLELDGSPVAVAIIEEPLPELEKLHNKITACMMVQSARRGAVFCSPGKNVICGGEANLGVGKSPIRKLDNLLLCKERLFKSIDAATRMTDLAKKWAPENGNYIAFSPLEKAGFMPDVVLFTGTPVQISRIIYLNAFDTGEIDSLHGEPLCTGTIAMPITSGKIGISFLDMPCRLFGRYKPEEMVIGVPYQKLSRIVTNIDLSSAGNVKHTRFLRMAERVLGRRIPVKH